MDSHIVRCFGLLLAEQARVEGMKEENASRLAQGLSPAYDEQAFCASAFAMEEITRKLS